MSLMFRRGTTGQQQSPTFVPDNGEPIWDYEAKKLYIGDANTAGGNEVAMAATLSTLAGVNLDYNGLTKAIDLNLSGVTTNNIAEGTNNKYFSTELAQDAAALLFSTGSHTGITFQYDDTLGKINAVVTVTGGGAMGGNLASNLVLNTFDITGTGDINITGDIDATGDITGLSLSASTILRTPVTSDTLLNPVIDFGTESAPVSIKLFSNTPTKDYAVLFGSCSDEAGPGFTFRTTRGTQLSKTTVLAGDVLASFKVTAFDGTDYRQAGEFGMISDPDVAPDNGFVPGMFAVSTINAAGGPQILTFGSTGVLNAPIIQATPYATGALPQTDGAASEGFIVFDTTTKQFKGWNGTAWVVLG